MTHALRHALYAAGGVPSNDPALWLIEPADKHGDGSVVVPGRGVISTYELKAFGDKSTLEGLRAAAKAVYDLYSPEVERLTAEHQAIEKPAYDARRRAEAQARADYASATADSRIASGAASRARWLAVMSVLPPL